MVIKVTSNLTQLAIAGAMAIAIAFPTPEDAADAFRGLFQTEQRIEVKAQPEAIVIQPPSAAAARFEAAPTPLENCLSDRSYMERVDLIRCAGMIQTSLRVEEPKPLPQFALLEHNREVRLQQNPQKTEALIQICRLLWVASNGYYSPMEQQVCAPVTSGIE